MPLTTREAPNSNRKARTRMATSYLQIAAQIEKLQTKAAQLKDKEKAGVVARIKEAIAAYGLTAEDLGLSGKGRASKGAKQAASKKGTKRVAGKRTKAAPAIKFRDDAGNTWSGRGPRPGWLKKALTEGAQLETFEVKQ